MTISFSGYFNVYSINSDKTVHNLFSQSLLDKIPNGIYCAEVDAKSEYLTIGSFASNSSDGLSVWRILNEAPWIKLFDTSVDQSAAAGAAAAVVRRGVKKEEEKCGQDEFHQNSETFCNYGTLIFFIVVK